MPFANPGQEGGGGANAPGPDAWFRSLPFVTRYFLGVTVALTLAVNFEVFPGMHVPFAWTLVKSKFELWRLFTCFFYAGGFSFNMLIKLYMLVTFSQQYEKGPYNTGAGGGTADYLFMMMFGATVTLLTYPLIKMVLPTSPIFCQNMISYVLYAWSRRNPTANANIWGIPVPGVYLPFAHLAFTVLMGDSYSDQLHGLAVGHLYYFLVDVVPQVQGKDILHTPQFLIDRLGVGEYRPEPEPQAPPPRGGGARVAGLNTPVTGGGGAPRGGGNTGSRGGGHNWGGSGQALGRG